MSNTQPAELSQKLGVAARCALAAEPFYRVRVWGTFGFILPAAGLYALMTRAPRPTWRS